MNTRRLAAIAAAFLFSLSAFAQSYPNSILWRISGKDGHHTSYLYGSMHLTDERIFDLGDSLYAAIRNSDGLATELDPSDLLSLTVQEAADQQMNKKKVKDLLSPKDYNVYGPLLAKKLKKPLGSITARDILDHKNKWMREQFAKGGMSTFLDMYLYEVARRQKKWTGGVEDPDDQRGILGAEESVDKSDIVDLVGKDQDGVASAELEKMIAVYLKQDLTAIDSFFDNVSGKDEILVKRNRKMADRMDSLSGVRSMVFVIGVAHLPGETGLIRLLRQRGFEVQPVFSSRKIKARDYPLPDLADSWEPVKDENGLFGVSMPGKPQDIDLYHLVRMKMYFDFLDMNGYCAAAVPSAYKSAGIDSVMDVVAARVFEGDKKTADRIEVDGVQGKAYVSASEEGYKKGYFLYNNGIFYMVYGTAVRGDEKNKEKIDRFLKSFEILDLKKDDSGPGRMRVHTDTTLAFSISTFGDARINTNTTTSAGHSKLYLSPDPLDGGYYLFGANEVAPGRNILDDSLYFQQLIKSVSDKLSHVSIDSSWVVNDQLATSFHGTVEGANMEMYVRYIGRGNRWYVLLAMIPANGKLAKVNQFFSSFRELDYPVHKWAAAVAPDSLFSTWTPARIRVMPKDSTSGTDIDKHYNSYDTIQAAGYGVVVYHLSRYYWSGSDSAFWVERIKAHIGYSDTLISKKAVSNGDARGWEIVKRGKRKHNYERLRILRNGNELYSLYVAGPSWQINTADADRFFSDFRFSRPVSAGTFLDSRAQQLIEDLLASDSAVAAPALAYMHSAPFARNDLPLLHQALLRVAPFRGVNNYWPKKVNDAIFSAISKLEDTSSYYFAIQHYAGVPDSEYFVRNNLLDLMVLSPDTGRFRAMAQLLRSDPPRHRLDEFFLMKLRDTLRLTATILPELLPLLKDTAAGPGFARIIVRAMDSGWLRQEQLLPYRDDILDYNRATAKLFLSDSDSYRYYAADMIRLCGRLRDNTSYALMRQLLHVRDKSIALAALEGLLSGKQAVDSSLIRPIAADRAYRLELFRLLEKAGRINLLPATYRTQKALGQSEVYDYLDDDLDDDFAITYVTSRAINTPQGKKNVLFYKYGSDDAVHLACAGPYVPGKLSTSDIHVAVDYHEMLDSSKLQGQIATLLKRFLEESVDAKTP